MADEEGRGGKQGRVVLEDDGSPALDLELDLGKKASTAPVQGAMQGDGATAPSVRPQVLGRAAAAVQRPVEPVVDKVEARLLAKYPQVPTKPWELPGYAKAVKARLEELEKVLADRSAKRQAAREQLDATLVSITRRVVTLCEGLSRTARQPYAPTLARISSQEAHLRSIDGERMAKVDAIRDQVVAIAKRLRPAENELERAQNEEKQAGAGLQGGAKSASPAQAQALEAARKKVAEAQAAVSILREERSKLEAAERDLASSSDPNAEAAREEYHATCADLAGFAMDDTANFGTEFTADRVTVANLRSVFEKLDKDAALYRAAADSYDREAVDKARTVIIGAAAAGALLLIILLVLVLK